MKGKLSVSPATRRYMLLTFLLIFSLATLSCGLFDVIQEAGKSKGAQAPAGSTAEDVQIVSPEALDSYRGRMVAQAKLKDGSESTETRTMEWIQEPRAGHYIYTKSSGEIEEQIFRDDTEWTKIEGDTWLQRGSLHSQGGPGSRYLALAYDIPSVFIWPDSPDRSLSLSKMILAGEETLGGIHCKHYVRDAALPYPWPVDATRFEIWVADQSDLPPVVVGWRQQLSLNVEDLDIVELKTEINIHDINAPIAIEPPEDVVTQGPTPQPTRAPFSSDTVQLASADTLGSYRGRFTMTVKPQDGSESTETRTLEWVSEPPSGHYVHTKSDGEVEERFVIGDTEWIKVSPDSWNSIHTSYGPGGQGFGYIAAPFTNFALSALEPDGSGTLKGLTLLGEETVSGIHCKHYVHEDSTPHVEIWVADQSDLPPVLIRVLVQASGVFESAGELILYDLNVPITIEPPH